MIVERGDIWGYLGKAIIVVPTNIGWRMDGSNVMGRGLALDAARRWPDLPLWYGSICRQFTEINLSPGCVFWPQQEMAERIILFPVKPCDRKKPWLSWKQRADLSLIKESLRSLLNLMEMNPEMETPIALPLVGCGNGRLDPALVRPMLEKHLKDDRFILVLRKEGFHGRE